MGGISLPKKGSLPRQPQPVFGSAPGMDSSKDEPRQHFAPAHIVNPNQEYDSRYILLSENFRQTFAKLTECDRTFPNFCELRPEVRLGKQGVIAGSYFNLPVGQGKRSSDSIPATPAPFGQE